MLKITLHLRSLVYLLLIGAILLTPLASQPARADTGVNTVPGIIYDMDMDYDDAATLAYLVEEDRLGRIDLLAVTVENNGAGLPGRAIRHARCIMERLGRSDVPIADGISTAPNTMPLAIRLSVETVLTTVLANCMQSEAPSTVPAPELIRQTLAARPDAQILTTGPLTNAAAALPVKASRLTTMGGAVRVPGNVTGEALLTADGSQELNMWVDPDAAQAALSAYATTMRFVPLDATNHVPITLGFITRLQADHHTPAADLVLSIASHPVLLPLVVTGQLYWWDPLAASSMIHSNIVAFEAGQLAITQTGMQAGRIVLTPTGTPTEFGNNASAAVFEQRFLDSLNRRP